VLRTARRAVLKTFSAVGLDDAAPLTRWQQQRLLILGYHGISLDDEHGWDAELYMPGSVLRRRLELIRDTGCRVLPLDEAVHRMYAGDLPPRRSCSRSTTGRTISTPGRSRSSSHSATP
jgi:hypothetical protein